MGIKYDEKSCGIIVVRDAEQTQYLILHYPNGHWDLPKGHVEKGEEEHDTARRELEEETGISDIEFVDGYREAISYKYRRRGKISNKQVVFFLARTSKSEIQLSHEHQDFLWLPYEKALAKLTFDNARNIVKRAKEFLS
jgi:bis(5'-nucleosidyl)-tetraphosphatase